MIAVDASAIVAILLAEPEADDFQERLLAAGGGAMSPVNYWEVLVRAQRHGGEAGRAVAEDLMSALGVEVRPCEAHDARAAADAFARFGKSSPAHLNLGDCFAYVLAMKEGEGLLFKGDDFPRTDVPAA